MSYPWWSRQRVERRRPAYTLPIGVHGLVIVDTPDALLVADQERAQDVSGLVAKLIELNRKEHVQHLKSYRPWGYFETFESGRFQVKLLHVKPGGQLSMQMHHHRSEHWVVVRGTAKVTIGDQEKLVQENESIYITATQWHRLENPGKVPLEMIEVQIGSYLGEDDIIRTDDVYHRAPDETLTAPKTPAPIGPARRPNNQITSCLNNRLSATRAQTQRSTAICLWIDPARSAICDAQQYRRAMQAVRDVRRGRFVRNVRCRHRRVNLVAGRT
jgi:mannose-6-phosphate isomerase-like protein (cupin superfamily)